MDREAPKPQARPQPLPLRVPSPPLQPRERLEEVREEEKEGGQIKMEVSSYPCQAAYPLPLPLTEAEPKPKAAKEPEQTHYSSCISVDSDSQESAQKCVPLEQTPSATCEEEQPDTPLDAHTHIQKDSVTDAPVYPPTAPESPLPLLIISPEDPMAGMLALLAASEMATPARPGTPPAPILLPQTEDASPLPVGDNCSGAGPLEMVALEGMALLSQMAQREMEQISQGQGEWGKGRVSKSHAGICCMYVYYLTSCLSSNSLNSR